MADDEPFAFVSGEPIPAEGGGAPVVATGVVEGLEVGKPGGAGSDVTVGEGIPDFARENEGVKGPGASTDYGASFEVSVALERAPYPRPGFTEDDITVGYTYQNVGPLTATWEYTVDGFTYNEGQGGPPYVDYINGALTTSHSTLKDAPESQHWTAREVRVFGLANSSGNSGEAFDIRYYVRQTSGPVVGAPE